ncbi:MAG TPA: hypothetical protein VJQ42_07175 [Rhodanobacteraceae bacterium]|nr:hypothetical protein [Rhodanobacteraceae bacterium]
MGSLGYPGDDEARAKRIRARFQAKLARLRAKGVRIVPGSTAEMRLWEAARRG